LNSLDFLLGGPQGSGLETAMTVLSSDIFEELFSDFIILGFNFYMEK